MNLISELPRTLSINNEVYEINTDFRKGIEFESLFKENLDNQEFWDRALKIYYPILDKTIMTNEIEEVERHKNILKNMDEAIKQMLWFHRCGKELPSKEEKQVKQEKEILSYSHDWELIVGAFKNQYDVNLYNDSLHWWEFKAYFASLKEDTKIKNIMNIRGMDISKMSKEQQQYYIEAKKIYAIPKALEIIEEEDEFDKMMMNGGDIAAFERN